MSLPRSLESGQEGFIYISIFLLQSKQSPFPLDTQKFARLLCSWL